MRWCQGCRGNCYCSSAGLGVHVHEEGPVAWVSFVIRQALVLRVPREKFFQFSWRPRAPSLLSEEQEREIQRNLKTHYSRRYDEEDLAALHEVPTSG